MKTIIKTGLKIQHILYPEILNIITDINSDMVLFTDMNGKNKNKAFLSTFNKNWIIIN